MQADESQNSGSQDSASVAVMSSSEDEELAPPIPLTNAANSIRIGTTSGLNRRNELGETKLHKAAINVGCVHRKVENGKSKQIEEGGAIVLFRFIFPASFSLAFPLARQC